MDKYDKVMSMILVLCTLKFIVFVLLQSFLLLLHYMFVYNHFYHRFWGKFRDQDGWCKRMASHRCVRMASCSGDNGIQYYHTK